MALTLRLLLPECRLAHLKKAPITTAGAYSKYPKDTALQGYSNPKSIRIPVKLELFKNNSNCLSFSFKRVYDLILKVE
jgi:hypothetical protein